MQNKAIIGTATATKVFAETAKKNTQIIDIMDANKRTIELNRRPLIGKVETPAKPCFENIVRAKPTKNTVTKTSLYDSNTIVSPNCLAPTLNSVTISGVMISR